MILKEKNKYAGRSVRYAKRIQLFSLDKNGKERLNEILPFSDLFEIYQYWRWVENLKKKGINVEKIFKRVFELGDKLIANRVQASVHYNIDEDKFVIHTIDGEIKEKDLKSLEQLKKEREKYLKELEKKRLEQQKESREKRTILKGRFFQY